MLLTLFAAVLATLVGMAGVVGEAEAILRFEGARWLLANHWKDVMLLAPGLCTTLGAVGGMLMIMGMRQAASTRRTHAADRDLL
ncbi:hypothetical protein [Geopseudomonas aromaticivorans]